MDTKTNQASTRGDLRRSFDRISKTNLIADHMIGGEDRCNRIGFAAIELLASKSDCGSCVARCGFKYKILLSQLR